MKSLKILSKLGLAGLLAGVSGIAMAEGCGDGVLLGERFDNGLRVTSQYSCVIIGSSIGGKLEMLNVKHVLLVNNRVDGDIQVDGNAKTGTVNVIENTVTNGNITVEDYETANVIGNEALEVSLPQVGSIRVNSNISAFVQQNIAGRNLVCENNTSLNSSYNVAKKKETCDPVF